MFEYKIEVIDELSLDDYDIVNILNKESQGGWELVEMLHGTRLKPLARLFFKRQLADTDIQ